MYGSSGNFTSPNYPYNYENNMNCTWYIHMDIGKIVHLYFLDFLTERYSDYVHVYDGSSTNSRQIGRYHTTYL